MIKYYTDFCVDGKPSFIALSRTNLYVYKQQTKIIKNEEQIFSEIMNVTPTLSINFQKSKDIYLEKGKNFSIVISFSTSYYFLKKHRISYSSEITSESNSGYHKLLNFMKDLTVMKKNVDQIFSIADLNKFCESN